MGERVLAKGTVVRLRADAYVLMGWSHRPKDVGIIGRSWITSDSITKVYDVLVPYRSDIPHMYYPSEFDVLQEPFTEGKEP